MGQRLVTIATFDQPAQARLAQNALEDAGIKAVVADESLVAMDWLLSGAVGGVKVQVWEEDAERAVAELERSFGRRGEGLGAADPEPPAEEAVAPEPEPESAAVPDDPPPPPPPEPGGREDYARRLVFVGMLGLMLPPVAAYAVYLFLNAAFGRGELSGKGRFDLLVGGLMAFSGMVWLSVLPFYLWPGD
ncbi:MAG: DUF2007 domain-containing protein [Gemmataceae bacterium]|nr:DUF2007 domain-containing protein [Gemmataceae bacterium]